MKHLLILLIVSLMLLVPASASSDEYGKEERKHYEEQMREERKHCEEQRREARKHREEQEREARKRYEERGRDHEKDRYCRHRHHEYRYYPSAGVYYDERKKVYFYLEGDRWGVSVNLPLGIHLDQTDFVTVESEFDRPYEQYPEHRRKYSRHE